MRRVGVDVHTSKFAFVEHAQNLPVRGQRVRDTVQSRRSAVPSLLSIDLGDDDGGIRSKGLDASIRRLPGSARAPEAFLACF